MNWQPSPLDAGLQSKEVHLSLACLLWGVASAGLSWSPSQQRGRRGVAYGRRAQRDPAVREW